MIAYDIIDFTYVDSDFFEHVSNVDDSESRFEFFEAVPPSWKIEGNGLYTSFFPPGVDVPNQGWKIHISSKLEDGTSVLKLITNFCVENRLVFKCLRSAKALFLYNSKNWSRSSSGKFISIYTNGEEQLADIVLSLDSLLSDFTGPYILTDFRFRDGPVFFRYGAFKERYGVDENGQRFLAIEAPNGDLVPDLRLPGKYCPSFKKVPTAIRDAHNGSRILHEQVTDDSSRFEITAAIKFSNAGGLYLATDLQTGKSVRLREARPNAGLDSKNRDAVERIHAETQILTRLEESPHTPSVISLYREWEHSYLATDFIEGRQLLDLVTEKFPFVKFDVSRTEIETYRRWVEDTCDKVRFALKNVHNLGAYVGDIHPSNIIVDERGEVFFIDLEDAGLLGDSYAGVGMRAAGFATSPSVDGREADLQSLDRMRLMMLYPMTALLDLYPPSEAKIREEVELLYRCRGASDEEAFDVVPSCQKPCSTVYEPGGNVSSFASSIAEGVLKRANFESKDRLFPADPRIEAFGKTSLGYGAAGIAFALSSSGAKVPEEVIGWILKSLDDPDAIKGCGLFDGQIGVALTLLRCGYEEECLRVLKASTMNGAAVKNDCFALGKAGIAYTLGHIGDEIGDPRVLESRDLLWRDLLEAANGDQVRTADNGKGIFSGTSGVAFSLLDAFERTGKKEFLKASKKLIFHDLESGIFHEDGTFHLVSGTKKLPYLHRGSSGIAVAAAKYLEFDRDSQLEGVLDAVKKAFSIPFVLQAGLFEGRAGLVHAAQCVGYDTDQDKQVERLDLYRVELKSGAAVAGRSLRRASDDLITGAAGILIALASLDSSSFLCIKRPQRDWEKEIVKRNAAC